MSSEGSDIPLPMVFDTPENVIPLESKNIPPPAVTDHGSQNTLLRPSSIISETSPSLQYNDDSLDNDSGMGVPGSHGYHQEGANAAASITYAIDPIRGSYEDVLASGGGSALAPPSPTPVEQAIPPRGSMDDAGHTRGSTERDGPPHDHNAPPASHGGSKSLDQAHAEGQIHSPPAGDERFPTVFAQVLRPQMVWVKRCFAISALALFLALIRFTIRGIFEAPGTIGAEGLGEAVIAIAAMGASQIDPLVYWWWGWKIWHKPYKLARQPETTIPKNTHAEPVQSFGTPRNNRPKSSTDTHTLTYHEVLHNLNDRIAPLEDFEQAYWKERYPNKDFDRGQLFADINEQIQNQPNTPLDVKSTQLNFKELQRLLSERDALVNPREEAGQYNSYVYENDDFPQTRHDGARFHAILIGVNTYRIFNSPLRGSVNDVNLMHKVCTKTWGVPEEQVTLLTSDNHDPAKQPTRENILMALYALRDIAAIAKGDNIIFYFSGHGTQYNASNFFTSPGPREDWIEAICPMDRGHGDPKSPVLDISDRELNIIVSEICAEKGCHASIIIDACHSGGMARAPEIEGRRQMGPLRLSLKKLLLSADQDPRRRKFSKRASSDAWVADQSARVYMAACQPHERAYERELGPKIFHGLFTYSLVRFLKSDSIGMTYAELEKKLGPLPLLRHDDFPFGLQSAYFTGERKGCKLFSSDG